MKGSGHGLSRYNHHCLFFRKLWGAISNIYHQIKGNLPIFYRKSLFWSKILQFNLGNFNSSMSFSLLKHHPSWKPENIRLRGSIVSTAQILFQFFFRTKRKTSCHTIQKAIWNNDTVIINKIVSLLCTFKTWNIYSCIVLSRKCLVLGCREGEMKMKGS